MKNILEEISRAERAIDTTKAYEYKDLYDLYTVGEVRDMLWNYEYNNISEIGTVRLPVTLDEDIQVYVYECDNCYEPKENWHIKKVYFHDLSCNYNCILTFEEFCNRFNLRKVHFNKEVNVVLEENNKEKLVAKLENDTKIINDIANTQVKEKVVIPVKQDIKEEEIKETIDKAKEKYKEENKVVIKEEPKTNTKSMFDEFFSKYSVKKH